MPYEKLLSQLHVHIRERAAEFGLIIDTALPSLDDLVRSESSMAWYTVPGMCGGFSYALRSQAASPVVDVESWSRVVGGSGKHCVLSEDSITLVSEGFV